MRIYQQYLAVSGDRPLPSVNASAQRMLQRLFAQIKSGKSARRGGDLVYEAVPTEYALPRADSRARTMTRWEKFAESKGIKSRRKSQLVYSEELKRWVPRWGSRSLQNMRLQGGVVEVEQSISRMKKEKQSRVAKNRKNMAANRRRLGQ